MADHLTPPTKGSCGPSALGSHPGFRATSGVSEAQLDGIKVSGQASGSRIDSGPHPLGRKELLIHKHGPGEGPRLVPRGVTVDRAGRLLRCH